MSEDNPTTEPSSDPDLNPTPQQTEPLSSPPPASPMFGGSFSGSEGTNVDPLNPWFSMWTKPRRTIRQMIDNDPSQGVLALVASAGALQSLGAFAHFQSAGANVPILLVIPGAAAIAVISLYFAGWVYRWVGSWFGGGATSEEVRAALAWAQVPSFVPYVCASLMLFAIKAGPAAQVGVTALWVLSSMVCGLWTFILALNTLAEVHRFTTRWLSFFTMLLGNIVLSVPLFFLILAAGISLPLMIAAQGGSSPESAIFKNVPKGLADAYRSAQSTRAGAESSGEFQMEAVPLMSPEGQRIMRSMSYGEEIAADPLFRQAEDVPESARESLDASAVQYPEKIFDFAGLRDSGKKIRVQMKNGKTAEGTVMMFNESEVVLDSPSGIKNIIREEILDVLEE